MARRSSGEGSIYRRADGRWAGAFVVGWVGGKPRKKTVYGKSRRAVAERLAKAQRDHASGSPVLAERQTLAQFAARYERDVLSGLSRNTQSNVSVALHTHILPALGHKRLSALRPGDIQAWYASHHGAPRSVRQYHGTLHRILAQAVYWGELAVNPADRVTPPKVQRQPPRFLEPPQAKRVLAALRGDRWEALAWLALTTGMRRGELLALQWGDVDFERGTVRVGRNYTRSEVRVPKSQAGQRTVPLVTEAAEALRRRRAGWPSAPWVVTSATGGMVSYDVLRKWWARAQRACGLVPVTWHSNRHACGSFLLDLGMPLPQVSRVLGHSSVAVTGAIYSHALSSGERVYLDKLGALLGGDSADEAVSEAVNRDAGSPQTAPIRQK